MTAQLSISGIVKTFGRSTALKGIDLEVADGEFLALLGPSGCGKTTLLRILAGLETADSGRILLGGDDVTARPAWGRDIGLVFQSYALFPHMTVAQNVAFGLEMRGIRGAEATKRVDEALDIVSMRDFAKRRPAQLSGGQQQRIAIARAIAIKPRLLLMDEPLSNLDAVLRQSVRVELRELHDRTGLTTIMVTHDQAEALTIADRVALLSTGQVEQLGSPSDIYERPASAFVAGFIGSPSANVVGLTAGPSGMVIGDTPWTPAPELVAELGGLQGAARLALRPEALQVVAADAPHAISGRVRAVEYMGAERLVHVVLGDAPAAPVLISRSAEAPPAIGSRIGLLPTRIAGIFDAETGSRLGPRGE